MTDTAERVPTAPTRLGHSITSRVNPPWWWAGLQLVSLAVHLPLSVLTGSQSAVASSTTVFTIAGVAAVASLAVYFLTAMFMGRWRALAVTSVSVLTFWHWSGVQAGPLAGPLGAILIYGLAVAAALKFSGSHLFRLATFVVSIALAASLGLLIVSAEVRAAEPIVGVQNSVQLERLSQTPDIVLIVLDGYGRKDVIESVYGYDNGPFLELLASHGFQVASQSVANYSITHLSIPALLNMSYMHPPNASIGNRDLRLLAAEISGDNHLVRMLKENGYTYVHAASDHWYSVCGEEVDICLPGPTPDITGHALLTRTPIGGFFYREAGDPTTALNLERVEQLTNWTDTQADWPEGPVFSFFHLQLPHPPLYLDAKCNVRLDPDLGGRIMNDGSMSEDQLHRRRAAWVEQISCANRTVEAFLEDVDPETVVVVVSDHGPDSNFMLEPNPEDLRPEGLAERFPTLAAVRLPATCRDAVPVDLDTVNVFRVVTGCLAGDVVDLLETHYYVAGFGGPIVELKLDLQTADD